MTTTVIQTWKVQIVCDLPKPEIEKVAAQWSAGEVDVSWDLEAEQLSLTCLVEAGTELEAIRLAVARLSEQMVLDCNFGITTFTPQAAAVEVAERRAA